MGLGLIWQNQANPGDMFIILTTTRAKRPFFGPSRMGPGWAWQRKPEGLPASCHAFHKQKARHREPTAHVRARYRCFLPDLAGLAGVRRVGPIPDPFHSSIRHRKPMRLE